MTSRTCSLRTLLAVPVAVALAFILAAPAHAGVKRLVWEFNSGACFEDQGFKCWVERDAAGKALFYFREVARNDDFIELFDRSRDVGIRLYRDVAYINTANTNGFARWKEGKWTK